MYYKLFLIGLLVHGLEYQFLVEFEHHHLDSLLNKKNWLENFCNLK